MITLYFYENVIQYEELGIVKEKMISKKAMENGRIKNISLFEKELHDLLQKEKWVTWFHQKPILIILPIHFEELEKELLTILLNNNGLKKIQFEKEQNYFSLKPNQIVVNLHQTYFTVLQKRNRLIKEYYPISLFKNCEEALEFMKKRKPQNSQFLFLGSNLAIPKIIEKQKKTNLFYFNNFKTFLMDYKNTLK